MLLLVVSFVCCNVLQCFVVKSVWCVYQGSIRGLLQDYSNQPLLFHIPPNLPQTLYSTQQPGPSSIKHVGVTSSQHPHYVKNPVSRKNMSISPQYPLQNTIIVKSPSVTRIGIIHKNIVIMKLSLIRIHVILPLVC